MELLRGKLRRAARRVGRRGAFLAFLALLDAAYGYSLLETTPAQQRTLDLLLPWQAWGIIWLATGAVCAAGMMLRTGADRLAFAAAAALKVCWGAVFIRVWLYDHLPRGWVTVAIWLAFAAVVLLVSSWPEPPRRTAP